MNNDDLIRITDDGCHIDYLGHELNVDNAILLTDKIRQLVASQPRRIFMLCLSEVKGMEANAARVLAELSNIEMDADEPYLFDFTDFGLEQLTEDVARYLAKFPSHFLIFDKITSLPESVACQFIGSDHALSFQGCSEFSPVALRALASSACFLDIGLKTLNVFQAKALAHFEFDLTLDVEQLPSDVLLTLGGKPRLCLPPDFGLERISEEEYENILKSRVTLVSL